MGGCKCTNCSCKSYSAVFEALGNQNRLHIINALRKEPHNVSEIIAKTGLEQTCVSHCLRKLEEGGLVDVERQGKFRVYTLNKKTVEPLLQAIDQHTKVKR
jgi:DNA-binding transcriptional ArsR family regulator